MTRQEVLRKKISSYVRKRPIARVALALLVLLYMVPLYWLVATSFRTGQDIASSPVAIFFDPTVDAYAKAFTPTVFRSVLNTLIISLSTMLLVLLIAVPAAFALARGKSKVVVLALAAVIIVQIIPPASAVIPLFSVLSSWGLAGSIGGLVLADATLFVPFAVLLLIPFFSAIPVEIEEAARIDGASMFTLLARVCAPVARNGIFSVAVFVFVLTWGELVYAISLLTDPKDYPMSALIANSVGNLGIQWDLLMALAVIGAIPILAVFLLAQKQLTEGLTAGAVK